MSVFEERREEKPTDEPGAPCLACGAPGPWVVWGHRVCIPCFQALAAVEPFTVTSIGHADNHQAFTAEATRRTAAWVAKKRSTKPQEKTP